MTKIRIILLLVTLIVVGLVGTGVILYAKGYRFDTDKNKLAWSSAGEFIGRHVDEI